LNEFKKQLSGANDEIGELLDENDVSVIRFIIIKEIFC